VGNEHGHAIRSKRFDELTTTELHEILRLRCEVFVVDQDCAYADIDGRDRELGTVHHWVAGDGDDVVAYLRALTEPDGTTRIGRVVTAPFARGRGLAAVLVDHVGAATAGELVLDAQSHLTGWYTALGYEVAGDEYVEDGIPHIPMRRTP
jgi:ElaA protein